MTPRHRRLVLPLVMFFLGTFQAGVFQILGFATAQSVLAAGCDAMTKRLSFNVKSPTDRTFDNSSFCYLYLPVEAAGYRRTASSALTGVSKDISASYVLPALSMECRKIAAVANCQNNFIPCTSTFTSLTSSFPCDATCTLLQQKCTTQEYGWIQQFGLVKCDAAGASSCQGYPSDSAMNPLASAATSYSRCEPYQGSFCGDIFAADSLASVIGAPVQTSPGVGGRVPSIYISAGNDQRLYENQIALGAWWYELLNKSPTKKCYDHWRENMCHNPFRYCQEIDWNQPFNGGTSPGISGADIATLPKLYTGTVGSQESICKDWYLACYTGSWKVSRQQNLCTSKGLYEPHPSEGPVLQGPPAVSSATAANLYRGTTIPSMFTTNVSATSKSIADSYYKDTFATQCPSPFIQANYVPDGGYTNAEYKQARCDWGCVPNVMYREDSQSLLNALVITAQVLSFFASLHLVCTWCYIPKKRKDTFIVATSVILLSLSLHSIGQWFFTENTYFTSTVCLHNTMVEDAYYEGHKTMYQLSAITLYFLFDALVMVWVCHVVTIAVSVHFPNVLDAEKQKSCAGISILVCMVLALVHVLCIFALVPLDRNFTAYALPSGDSDVYALVVPQWIFALIGTVATLAIVAAIAGLEVADESQKAALQLVNARLLAHNVLFILYFGMTLTAMFQVIEEQAAKRALENDHHTCAKAQRYLIGFSEFVNCPIEGGNNLIWFSFHILLGGAGAVFWPVYGTMADNYTGCMRECAGSDSSDTTGPAGQSSTSVSVKHSIQSDDDNNTPSRPRFSMSKARSNSSAAASSQTRGRSSAEPMNSLSFESENAADPVVVEVEMVEAEVPTIEQALRSSAAESSAALVSSSLPSSPSASSASIESPRLSISKPPPSRRPPAAPNVSDMKKRRCSNDRLIPKHKNAGTTK